MRLRQLGAGVTVWVVGGVVVVLGVRVRVGDAGMPVGLSHCRLRVATGDEVPVLELGTPGLLGRQLELHEHHVITNTQRQGEGGAAGQEVTDLQINKTGISIYILIYRNMPKSKEFMT